MRLSRQKGKDGRGLAGAGWCEGDGTVKWGVRSLGKYASVFQAELVAIKECVRCIGEEFDAAEAEEEERRRQRKGRTKQRQNGQSKQE